jgi:hypothetical protein
MVLKQTDEARAIGTTIDANIEAALTAPAAHAGLIFWAPLALTLVARFCRYRLARRVIKSTSPFERTKVRDWHLQAEGGFQY